LGNNKALNSQFIEPFLPFDLESLFSSTFAMILVKTIGHPAIPIDNDGLSMAHRILTWMGSNGNMVAVSRKSDLDELHEMCEKVNMAHTAPLPGGSPVSEDVSWLWNALDIDRSLSQMSRAEPSSILLMDSGLTASDMTIEDQWLWTASEFETNTL
jgi:hypothetical protein